MTNVIFHEWHIKKKRVSPSAAGIFIPWQKAKLSSSPSPDLPRGYKRSACDIFYTHIRDMDGCRILILTHVELQTAVVIVFLVH